MTSVFNENISNFTLDLIPGKVHGTLPGNNEHILVGDNLVAMPAETFSEKPLYPVTDNRIAYF